MSHNLIYLGLFAGILGLGYFGWKMSSRTAYESAEYVVLESDGNYEIRDYSELWLATTDMRSESQGDDGSFMRLFRYISGGNQQDQKVAMTTPVFMESESTDHTGQMGFVVPRSVAAQQIPEPTNERVQIRKRDGGKFAVIRFAGRSNDELVNESESKLRQWMMGRGLVGEGPAEMAGYDPPWIPGLLRRNEVLIRLKK